MASAAPAVEFVDPENYRNPSTGLIDITYTPPALPRPSNSVMAKVQGSSGVVVAPNWILTAKHIATDFRLVGVWVDGTPYSVAYEYRDTPADLALLRIVQWNGDGDARDNPPANFANYVGIDPDIHVAPGMLISQGGFGDHIVRDANGNSLGYTDNGAHLRWGRNVIGATGTALTYD